MKWIKVAIGAVIAVISLGIVATSVAGITQETVKVRTVTFEILTESAVTSGTYDLFVSGIELDGQYFVTDIYINDTSVYDEGYLLYDYGLIEIYSVAGVLMDINDDDTFVGVDYSFEIGDTVVIIFEVTQPPQLTGVTAILILLAPLIFVGGVLGYLLYKQNGLQD